MDDKSAAVDAAYQKMNKSERAAVDELAQLLMEGVEEKRHGQSMRGYALGEKSARELVGKLGMFLVEARQC